jgi:hypothetical protein
MESWRSGLRQYLAPHPAKLIDGSNFWFLVESLYFQNVQPADLVRIDQARSRMAERPTYRLNHPHSATFAVKETYDMDDDVFILLNRSLAQRKLGNTDMRDTSV